MASLKSEATPVQRGALRGGVLWSLRFCLLGGAVHAACSLGILYASAEGWFDRVAWWIGPWRSFPFPYHSFSDPVSEPVRNEAVGLFVILTAGSTIAMAALYGLVFCVVVVAHVWLGRPPYWRDVRPRFRLQHLWDKCVRRGWWAWPAGLSAWFFLEEIGRGCSWACYQIIGRGTGYFIASLAAILFVFAVASGRVLRATVIRAVGRDERRCNRCGYLLRGLEALRCPECGLGGEVNANPVYGFRRRSRPYEGKPRNVIPITVVVGVLLAPAWLHFALMPLRPGGIMRSFYASNVFPIRLDAVCVIRHGNAVAVVRFDRKSDWFADYAGGYWANASAFAQRNAPDTMSSGRVAYGGGPVLLIGPWQLSYAVFAANVLWLNGPDANYSVEAFTKEQASKYLFWLPDQTP